MQSWRLISYCSLQTKKEKQRRGCPCLAQQIVNLVYQYFTLFHFHGYS
jgi:hypothetical protein